MQGHRAICLPTDPGRAAVAVVRLLPTGGPAIAPGVARSRMVAMPDSPMSRYRAKLAAGEIQPDPGQELAVMKLQSLHGALHGYVPSRERGGRGFLRFLRKPVEEQPAPNGLYIYGDVGRGKSMLMDLLFDGAPVERKRRVHFHAFMQEIHARLHSLRQNAGDDRKGGDVIPRLADEIATETTLLCFDEFVVNNIADAMILGRLFEACFERGVIVVATSNFAPDDLYRDGLQRERFLPFVALLKERMDVLQLEGATDYRMVRLSGVPTWHVPADTQARAELDRAFRRLADGELGAPEVIDVQGRALQVGRAAGGIGWFGFAELCDRPRGAPDFLAIARRYHAIILEDVPAMGPESRNQARRFITLIDALYEHNVTLVCSAAGAPHKLYQAGEGAFEFMRTVSRLVEMQSAHYQGRPHRGG